MTTVSQARDIMGMNFHGLEDVESCFGAALPPEQRALLTEIPFPEGLLQECKATYILFPAYPISVLGILERHGDRLMPFHDPWNRREPLARSVPAARWCLLPTGTEPGPCPPLRPVRIGLREGIQALTACEALQGALVHLLTTGEGILAGCNVRTTDRFEHGTHATVGDFNPRLGAFYIGDELDENGGS